MGATYLIYSGIHQLSGNFDGYDGGMPGLDHRASASSLVASHLAGRGREILPAPERAWCGGIGCSESISYRCLVLRYKDTHFFTHSQIFR